ncbi:MAG: pantoate--beta-alanine ligase [Bacteroidetes bacterium]|nr:pantoate--beta-alanine ligase [Bacteroidota bacterium]
MNILTQKAELKGLLDELRAKGKTIGFVPTMGALHAGHISLIEIAQQQCHIVVCSIFVNPTQFNDKKDLERYPRTIEKDTELLVNAKCDILFYPEVGEMYPEEDKRTFDFGFLDRTLDGAFRPGHFNGVGQIVSKLFDAVKPHKAFFGEKDFQQVLVIKEMVRQLNYKVEIISCPILREKDGLAMSSRNTLLNELERAAASLIPKIMKEAKMDFESGASIEVIKSSVKVKIEAEPLFKLDYFEIRNTRDLNEFNPSIDKEAVMLIAVFCGRIRLIDNLVVKTN